MGRMRGAGVVGLALAAASCSKTSPAGAPSGVPPLAAAPAPAAAPGPAPTPGTELPRDLVHAFAAMHPRTEPAAQEDDNAAPNPSETISGTIVLPPAMRARVARGDVMFLAARRAEGGAGPAAMLAVQKLEAGDFPLRFSVSSRDAMMPGVPFAGRVSLTVRVDKDGDAMTRRKGDVYGQVKAVEVGASNVVITLDKVQPEDQTLGQVTPPSQP